METIVTGILLGGTYALVALGLTLQYGVARIMNLANGETLVAACFIAFWLFTSYQVSPLWGLLLIAPAAFVINWAIYAVLLRPLVERAKNEGMLEVDSILATFGLLFLFQGLMLRGFGGAYTSYSYLAERFEIFGTFYGLNRVVAFAAAFLIASALYLFLYKTRYGTAVRAVAVNPASANLVGIDVARAAALSFALGGALAACGGTLISTFYTFNASMGVVFTMKALDHRHHGRRRRRARRGDRGADPRHRRDIRRAPDRSRPDAGGDLRAVHFVSAVPAARHFRQAAGMNGLSPGEIGTARGWCSRRCRGRRRAAAVTIRAITSRWRSTSCSMPRFARRGRCFPGPTHYVSLATAAFFGLGTYAIGLGLDHLPFPVLVLIGRRGGGDARRPGRRRDAAHLRRLFRYLHLRSGRTGPADRVLCADQAFKSRMGLYVFTDFTEKHIYWMLLALTVAVF